MAVRGEKPLQGLARVWFRYLQMAQIANEPIDWAKYEQWGSPEELSTLSFNAWWKLRGKSLFTPQPKKVRVVDQDQDGITLWVPFGERRELVAAQVKRLLAEYESHGSYKDAIQCVPTGRVNVEALIRYQRMLEVDLESKKAGLSFADKVRLLQQRYEKNFARLKKQQDTLKAKNSPRRLKKPRMAKVTGREGDTKLTKLAPEMRVAYRWLAQAKIVMKNVAAGSFPGEGYYQRKGEPSLGKQLASK